MKVIVGLLMLAVAVPAWSLSQGKARKMCQPVLKDCIRELRFPTPTTTTTTTTMPPRTVRVVISHDVFCDGPSFSSSITFTVMPSAGVITFVADVLPPKEDFCWPDQLTFVQGVRQIGVTTGTDRGKVSLAVDGAADWCEQYVPGVRLTGTLSNFPADFNLAAPFRAYFYRYTNACRGVANGCGNCTVDF